MGEKGKRNLEITDRTLCNCVQKTKEKLKRAPRVGRILMLLEDSKWHWEGQAGLGRLEVHMYTF